VEADERRALRKQANALIRAAEQLEREIAVATNGESPDLVGTFEAAEILGVKPNTLSARVARGQFIEPVLMLRCGPLWWRSEVERAGSANRS
jgi:hypothetical protein